MRFLADLLLRHPKTTLLSGLVFGAFFALLLTASGLIPITASSGHWPITEWFLHFAMRRSVVTHALLVDGPPAPLDDASLVVRGAGHYEIGCRPCHGAPGDRMPRVPKALTPPPPELSPRIRAWTDRQLFYVVKHGVKFTGMPAWPAQGRDDEVWAVVAFLRTLPGLDSTEYEALVRGGVSAFIESLAGHALTPSPPDIVAERCARCHGLDGNGRGVAAFPRLAGQRLEYMSRALNAYADGRRHSGIMEPIATGLSEEARDAAVRYYSSLPPPRDIPRDHREAAASRGQRIATRGIPEQDVPSCVDCHAPGEAPVNDAYPRLAGQYRQYIVQQLLLMQKRKRGGSEFVHIMHAFVDRLTRAQIEDVAWYLGSPDANGYPDQAHVTGGH